MEESDPRRRFQRIFLVGIHELKELIGARVQWENAQRTDILDMSYTGLSVVRPSGIEFEKGKRLKVQLLFSGFEAQNVEVILIRESEKIFGVQFSDLTKANIDVLDQFLSDKLLGRSLRTVNPKFFNPRHDFDHWLHGPNHTNLYIWQDGQKIRKAVLEFGGQALTFENGFSLQKLDAETHEEDYVVFPITKPKEAPVHLGGYLKRALKVLSQVEGAPTCVWTLIDLVKDEAEKHK